MRLSAAASLWGVAGVLAAGLLMEWTWPMRSKLPAVMPPPAAAGALATAAAEPVEAWAAAMLARPVFSPDRRPEPAGAEPSAAVDTRHEPPRLAGILITPQGRRAMFATAGEGGRTAVAGEGVRVAGWLVEAIHAQDVLLSGPDGRRVVRPSYSDGPPPTPVAAAPLPATDLLPPLPVGTAAPGSPPSGADIFRNAPALPVVRTPR